MARYRIGRSLGRTVYDTDQTDPVTGDDLCIGMMDTRELGAMVVGALNRARWADVPRSDPDASRRPAPQGLRLLADWFDIRDDVTDVPAEQRKVQLDLRQWADEFEAREPVPDIVKRNLLAEADFVEQQIGDTGRVAARLRELATLGEDDPC